jgi:5-formaminoimidazole-4-carboxamide-1-beta-D-ribofuranosyl 5'-monophosphate synthetase
MTDAGLRWERGWEGHQRAQLLRQSRLSLPEKIQWLEDAHRTVLALQHARQSGGDGSANRNPGENA